MKRILYFILDIIKPIYKLEIDHSVCGEMTLYKISRNGNIRIYFHLYIPFRTDNNRYTPWFGLYQEISILPRIPDGPMSEENVVKMLSKVASQLPPELLFSSNDRIRSAVVKVLRNEAS